MPIYSYRGMDRSGKEIKNTVNVESIAAAKQKIKSMGIMLIDIREQKAQGTSGGSSLLQLRGSVNVEDLAMMTRQLATLIKAKIQIVEALAALVDQVDNATLRLVLADLRQKVNEGASLAKALQDHPKVFNSVYVNMVEAGEASGTLEIVLLRLADFTEAQVKLKNKIKGAMTYPVIMAVFGFAMMNVIFIFVIPKMAKIFTSTKRELPFITKVCIWISEFLQNYWWLMIAAIIGGAFLLNKYLNTNKGRAQWHSLQLKLPVLGMLIKMINVSRFCSTLGTLMNSGVPILTALNIVKNLIPNVHMKDAVEKARISVSEGASITNPLIQSGYFPALVTHMIRLGERSGELEPMLKIISENYEDQVESKISGLTSILEPIMMICLGVAVGFIVFAVVIPMMDLNKIS
ncbi:type II secretion system inner membrane protein GspF [Peredibacter starrii]|uniref:Type II secretion system inner membrane protein GspF n=1 Tax=Peredibacter starrii TaxID=28202 RepID=A0AAX4HLB1_9BACT|nr:type II secretion system inner membrane protein GspF [Peredibacter starrii]WPU64011.1 type II secretion system inner membrane protein GspF [Peredibacter starrii]